MGWFLGEERFSPPEQEDKSWWDEVIDAIGSVVDFIAWLVNWASAAWESIKSFAIDQLASIIPGCDSTCKDLLESGLNAGLAAMRIPPSDASHQR